MNAATMRRIREAQRARRPIACATDLGGGGSVLVGGDAGPAPEALLAAARAALDTDRPRIEEIAGTRYFVEPFNPRPRLVVVGAVHIAQALAGFASLAGFEVFVIDPRDSWARRERFPGVEVLCAWPQDALAQIGLDARTAVAALTHDPKIDDPALQCALSSPVPYVGALGSPKTHASRLARLAEAGVAGEDSVRIHAPIGLDIGAAQPAEIALAIMAEIVSVFRGGKAGRR